MGPICRGIVSCAHGGMACRGRAVSTRGFVAFGVQRRRVLISGPAGHFGALFVGAMGYVPLCVGESRGGVGI